MVTISSTYTSVLLLLTVRGPSIIFRQDETEGGFGKSLKTCGCSRILLSLHLLLPAYEVIVA
jgi:hypothetical protein